MDGEHVPSRATLKVALYWRQIYTEILDMEGEMLAKIRRLMAKQLARVRTLLRLVG